AGTGATRGGCEADAPRSMSPRAVAPRRGPPHAPLRARRRRTGDGSGRVASKPRAAKTGRRPANARAPRLRQPAPPPGAARLPESAAATGAAALARAAAGRARREAHGDATSRERLLVRREQPVGRRVERELTPCLPPRRRAEPRTLPGVAAHP